MYKTDLEEELFMKIADLIEENRKLKAALDDKEASIKGLKDEIANLNSLDFSVNHQF